MGRQMKRRTGKGKGKVKGRSKRTRRAIFGDEQTQDTEWRQEEDPLWWSKGKKGKKGLSKGSDGFHKGGFRPCPPDKGAGKDFSQNKGKGMDQKKEKAEKEPILNPGSQPQKHPMKMDMARPGNQTIGLPVIGLTILGLQMLGVSFFCMDGSNSTESCQPSNTRGSGSWLHTVDWIKSGNRKDPECGRTQLLHQNMRYPRTRASEQKIPQFWAEKQKVKPYATLQASCRKSATHGAFI